MVRWYPVRGAVDLITHYRAFFNVKMTRHTIRRLGGFFFFFDDSSVSFLVFVTRSWVILIGAMMPRARGGVDLKSPKSLF